MEPDLGSAIEPNANRRPRRATRFNTGIAMRPLGNRRMTLDEYFGSRNRATKT